MIINMDHLKAAIAHLDKAIEALEKSDGFQGPIHRLKQDKQQLEETLTEWCSCSENLRHAYRTGLKKGPRIKPVMCIEMGVVYCSMQEASRKTGICEGSISQSVRKGHASYGLHWSLINKE